MKTQDLIASLATDLTPVRRLRPPGIRAAGWLLLALLVIAFLAICQGVRPDIGERLHQSAFAFGVAASLLTGALAAAAAFLVSLPDRSRFWLLLPLPAFAAWLANTGYQCVMHWTRIGPSGIGDWDVVRCCTTVVLTSLPLSLAMLVMLSHAAPIRPTAVALVGSLAIAAFTATALALFLAINASAFILVWNFGMTAVFGGVGATCGRRLLCRFASRTAFRRP